MIPDAAIVAGENKASHVVLELCCLHTYVELQPPLALTMSTEILFAPLGEEGYTEEVNTS